MQMTLKHRRYMMWVVMCLMFMPPGMWVPSLPNILQAQGVRWVLPYAMALTPLCAMFSALMFGALSDRKMNAEKLLGFWRSLGRSFCGLVFSHWSMAGTRAGICSFKAVMR